MVLFAGLFRNDPRHNAGIYIYIIYHIYFIYLYALKRGMKPLHCKWNGAPAYCTTLSGAIYPRNLPNQASRLHEQQIDNRGDLAPGPRAFCVLI